MAKVFLISDSVIKQYVIFDDAGGSARHTVALQAGPGFSKEDILNEVENLKIRQKEPFPIDRTLFLETVYGESELVRAHLSLDGYLESCKSLGGAEAMADDLLHFRDAHHKSPSHHLPKK